NAVDYFSRAVASDPAYAPAWSGLSEAYLGLADYGSMPTPEAFALAEKAIDKAKQIAPEAPETLVAQGNLMNYRGLDYQTTPLYESAVRTNPNNVEALMGLAQSKQESAPREALELANKAWSLDPLAETTRTFLIDALRESGDTEGAIRKAREFLLDEPDNPGLFEALGLAYQSSGQNHMAIHNFEMTWNLRPGDVWPAMMITRRYLVLGDLDSALLWKDKARERGADSRHNQVIDLVLHYHQSEWESLAAIYEQMLANDTLIVGARLFYGDALRRTGKPVQAERMYRSVADLFDDAGTPITESLHADATVRLLGLLTPGDERERRMRALEEYGDKLVRTRPDDNDVWVLQAEIAALQDDQQALFDAVNRAVDLGAIYRHGWEVNPLMRPWRDHPEFRAILSRMDDRAREQRELLEASRTSNLSTDIGP
ncbi:MAG TPA: hypothetical protein VK830_01735, partial [Xanthomonadales bacterium]|nr:hypothetical protein [Xanthomonadales bacterium]